MHLGLGTSRHAKIVASSRTALAVIAQKGRYKSTPRVADRVVPLYEAEIVVEVEMRTKEVLTVKVALVAPAGTITLEGTLAAPLLLERKT
jgi:hypothetical protein